MLIEHKRVGKGALGVLVILGILVAASAMVPVSTVKPSSAGLPNSSHGVRASSVPPTSCVQSPVPLNSSGTYAVLANSTVTNTGATVVIGNLGLYPGTSVTGFPPGIIAGKENINNVSAARAQQNLTSAYNNAAARTTCAVSIAGNLGGLTLKPGLYKSTSTLAISSGDLTLDGNGSASSVFIFQIASGLTTTSGRMVNLTNGTQASNVFWQVGSSATLGTTSTFEGTILAYASVTLATGAQLHGRALARTGAVTMDTNGVVVPGRPTARMDAMMAYDAHDGYLVLFGGSTHTGKQLGDTWTYHAGAWTQLALSHHPQAREGGSMTYDAADGYILLFGGCGAVTCPIADTWKFVSGAWTQLMPTSHPTIRVASMMTYDAGDGYVVLFGGTNAANTIALSDTWKFVGGAWTKLAPVASPPARFQGIMAYDSHDSYVLLFGGSNAAGTSLVDTWTFSAVVWTPHTLVTHPSARDSGMMSYDANDSYVVFFGGATSTGDRSDTWTFVAGIWTQHFPATHPTTRDSAAMAFDASDSYVLLFAGSNTAGTADYSDTWSFVGGVWTSR